MPIAIEVFETNGGAVRIDINGEIWACVPTYQLPDKLEQVARAYIGRDLARLLSEGGAESGGK